MKLKFEFRAKNRYIIIFPTSVFMEGDAVVTFKHAFGRSEECVSDLKSAFLKKSEF